MISIMDVEKKALNMYQEEGEIDKDLETNITGALMYYHAPNLKHNLIVHKPISEVIKEICSKYGIEVIERQKDGLS